VEAFLKDLSHSLRMFRHSLAFTLAAVAALALGLTRFIASILYDVKAWDPLVFVSVPVLLAAVALLAVWLPAGRASRVSPIVALRYE
jgi:ABC-type lipoprotein release transport system permease subunit